MSGENLKDRLALARGKLGMSQRGIAQAIGCSARSWEKYESGLSAPGSQILQGIGKLGINLDWLLTGQGLMMRAEGTDNGDAPADDAGRAYNDIVRKTFVALEALYAEEGEHITQKNMGWFNGYVLDHALNISRNATNDAQVDLLIKHTVDQERLRLRNFGNADPIDEAPRRA